MLYRRIIARCKNEKEFISYLDFSFLSFSLSIDEGFRQGMKLATFTVMRVHLRLTPLELEEG